MCSDYIKSHIMQLPATQIFTTREVLQYGLRGAVDQALSRLVRAEEIVRLAPGVFVRDDSLKPSLYEIAKAKMTAWNKSLFTHAENLLISMQLLPENEAAASVIAVDSHSSSFMTVAGRVHVKGIGNRRVRLSANVAGRIAYALWHLNQKVCTREHVSKATENLKRTEREDFRRAAAMMPAWLTKLCMFRFPPPKVAI